MPRPSTRLGDKRVCLRWVFVSAHKGCDTAEKKKGANCNSHDTRVGRQDVCGREVMVTPQGMEVKRRRVAARATH